MPAQLLKKLLASFMIKLTNKKQESILFQALPAILSMVFLTKVVKILRNLKHSIVG